MTKRLRTSKLCIVRSGRNPTPLLTNVELDVGPGQILSIIGPNGSGKSTLLSVLAGSRSPLSGSVFVEGHDVQSLSITDRSRYRAVLTQDHFVGFAFSVDEVIRMGRHPYRKSETRQQHEHAVEAAIEAMELHDLLTRSVLQLSGGEQARVAIARVLAQATPTVMLDEPTAALDLRYQQRLITHCESLADSGSSIVMVVHDLSVAARSDLVGLIYDQTLIVDTPANVLTASRIEAAFNVEVRIRHTNNDALASMVVGVDLGLTPRRLRTLEMTERAVASHRPGPQANEANDALEFHG